jgi:hypothetical protein
VRPWRRWSGTSPTHTGDRRPGSRERQAEAGRHTVLCDTPSGSAASSSPPDFGHLALTGQHPKKSTPSGWPGKTQRHNRETRDVIRKAGLSQADRCCAQAGQAAPVTERRRQRSGAGPRSRQFSGRTLAVVLARRSAARAWAWPAGHARWPAFVTGRLIKPVRHPRRLGNRADHGDGARRLTAGDVQLCRRGTDHLPGLHERATAGHAVGARR